MRQAGRMPFPFSYGLETLFPGPATHNGVLPAGGNGSASLDIVEGMLGALHAFDPKTFGSANQTGQGGYWHDDMMWYGPAGIGSNFRWEGFVKDHRLSFLRAFPDRKGGNHYCRIGDGDYAAVSGWPSMTMTFQGDYLGIKADGRPLTLRVMDFYRCTQGQIIENWVMLDYMDLMAQMGVDLIANPVSQT
jgi:predicted ester cyclase